MSEEPYIPSQTFTYDGEHYRRGREMPREVAEELGLLNGGSEEGDEEPSETPLPESFPKSDSLFYAGYETVEAVDEAPDEALEAINGIGPATREDIREAVDEELDR